MARLARAGVRPLTARPDLAGARVPKGPHLVAVALPANDPRETYKTLDLGLRIGEILLSSGAGAADVTATMQAVTRHFGLRNAEVDVTFTALRMAYQSEPDEMPVMLARTIAQRDIDYDDLTGTQDLVQDVLDDRVGLTEARARVARLNSVRHWLPPWAVVGGSGLLGGAVALILDGGVVVTLVAVLAGVLVTLLTRAMNRERWPTFYQQIAGGLLATLLALSTIALDLKVDANLVITASIVLLLSGIGFMGAIQDALTGFYVTAGARILEAMLATAGLIAGVSAGLALAPVLGVSLVDVRPGDVGLAPAPVVLVGAVIAATTFGLTVYAPPRALPAIAMTTILAHLVYLALQDPAQSMPWARACAAVVVGAVSYSIAGRVRVPPLVVVVPAIVPMLPGLAIYQGLSYLSAGDSQGILSLTSAAASTIALAAGVILGEYAAQPLKRNARRVEDRLAGPRLVGVLHGHRVHLGAGRRGQRLVRGPLVTRNSRRPRTRI